MRYSTTIAHKHNNALITAATRPAAMPDPEPRRGVWAWIASVAPPQELDEIARAIGRKTIDRNAVSDTTTAWSDDKHEELNVSAAW
jgi:hypothetical protein